MSGPGTTLRSPLMGAGFRSCFLPQAFDGASPAAFTGGPEPDPPEPVAADTQVCDAETDRDDTHSVQHAESVCLRDKDSSTPHRRADAVRSASAVPKGWVEPRHSEALGDMRSLLSVAPEGSTAEAREAEARREHVAAGDVPSSVPAGHEVERLARLRRWQTTP